MAGTNRQWTPIDPPDPGRTAVPPPKQGGTHALLAAGLRSEWNYFSAGAQSETRHGCRFAHMPGLAHMPAACVGFLDKWPGTRAGLEDCLTAIEERFRSLGAQWHRIYLHAPDAPLAAVLDERGYSMREEIIHVRQAGPDRDWGGCALEAVRIDTDRLWAEKLDIHLENDCASDGHDSEPLEWVEMERRKVEAGGLDIYLLRKDGVAVATTGFVPVSRHVIRAKNLLVRPGLRRSGIGREAVRFYFDHTAARGATHVLLLSVAGTSSERLYNSMGATVVGAQVEAIRRAQ